MNDTNLFIDRKVLFIGFINYIVAATFLQVFIWSLPIHILFYNARVKGLPRFSWPRFFLERVLSCVEGGGEMAIYFGLVVFLVFAFGEDDCF
jgi:hypothetical protein